MSAAGTRLFVYEDAQEGFRGYLAYAGAGAPLAAGGLRIQRGLTGETIAMLAEAMQLKEAVLRLHVDGAKCGIDYDPHSPGRHEALRRFLRFLKPHLEDRLSLGPDMGTVFPEIERLAREEGIASVKGAIARAQGMERDEVLGRLALLSEPVGALTLGERRAGHALSRATLAIMRHLGQVSWPPTYAMQGWGTLARGTALSLHEAGVRAVAVADEYGSVAGPTGLDVPTLLAVPRAEPVTGAALEGVRAERDAVLAAAADVLVLAACENAMTVEQAERVQARAVVVGANHGLEPEVEQLLHERGVLVVPDFIGGSGGSASMDALFAPATRPTPALVLDRVSRIVSTLVEEMMRRARRDGEGTRSAALALAAETALPGDASPYGLRLLDASPHLRGRPRGRAESQAPASTA